jgi:DNA-binding NarL/FixJ family response regulator
MIESWMIDQLSDIECLVLDAILRHNRYRDVAVELNIPFNSISTHMNQIYKHLGVWPHKPNTLRMIFRQSVNTQRLEWRYQTYNRPKNKGPTK